jgi:hypothetical protein
VPKHVGVLHLSCSVFYEVHLLVNVLKPLPYCDRRFESHRGHGCWSVVSVVCCQVEVSATDWSLVQRSPTECGASLCVIKKPRKRGGSSPARGLQNTNPQWVVAPVEKIVGWYINFKDMHCTSDVRLRLYVLNGFLYLSIVAVRDRLLSLHCWVTGKLVPVDCRAHVLWPSCLSTVCLFCCVCLLRVLFSKYEIIMTLVFYTQSRQGH